MLIIDWMGRRRQVLSRRDLRMRQPRLRQRHGPVQRRQRLRRQLGRKGNQWKNQCFLTLLLTWRWIDFRIDLMHSVWPSGLVPSFEIETIQQVKPSLRLAPIESQLCSVKHQRSWFWEREHRSNLVNNLVLGLKYWHPKDIRPIEMHLHLCECVQLGSNPFKLERAARSEKRPFILILCRTHYSSFRIGEFFFFFHWFLFWADE